MGKRGGGKHARARQPRADGAAELAGAAALLTAAALLVAPSAEAAPPRVGHFSVSGALPLPLPLPGPQSANWGYQAVCGPLGPQGGSGFGANPGIGFQAFW